MKNVVSARRARNIADLKQKIRAGTPAGDGSAPEASQSPRFRDFYLKMEILKRLADTLKMKLEAMIK